MRFYDNSKQHRLFKALKAGQQLTKGQITQRFGLRNPSAAVGNLRWKHGIPVSLTEQVNSRGQTTFKYTLETAGKSKTVGA